MSRKVRETKKHFKVFCEGDTEYHYIDELRHQKKLSITLKPVNMKGGGYSNFLEQIKIDGGTNCLAKFIIVDGDRAAADVGEKRNLKDLLAYCILQNKSGRIPHFIIVDYPDFEYIACLHTPGYKGQDVAQYIVKGMGYKSVSDFKADGKVYSVLNTNGNSYERMLSLLKRENCFLSNDYVIDKKYYEIRISATKCEWDNLGRKGLNLNEFFEVIGSFHT